MISAPIFQLVKKFYQNLYGILDGILKNHGMRQKSPNRAHNVSCESYEGRGRRQLSISTRDLKLRLDVYFEIHRSHMFDRFQN